MTFWQSSFLWLDAVVASMAVAAVCAVVGVYAILRRVVFLPAALAQVSGLGVMVAFLLAVTFPAIADHWVATPEAVVLVVTLGAALALGWMREPRPLSREAAIGIAYVGASALVLLIGDRIPQDTHDIKDVLFGNAVAVERSQMVVALVVTAIVLAVHAWLFRPFLLVSFDADAARAHGVPVRGVDAALFLTLGLAISVGTKTIGAMPVFAFTVLPSAAALLLFRDVRLVLVGAGVAGAISAFVGYWLSFVFSFPTGACTVAVAAALLGCVRASLWAWTAASARRSGAR